MQNNDWYMMNWWMQSSFEIKEKKSEEEKDMTRT